MQLKIQYRPRKPADFPNWSFPNLDFEYHAETQSVWMFYKEGGAPYYTMDVLADIADLQESLRRLFQSYPEGRPPVRYFVMASHQQGVFNLGGDLAMFARSIRDGDRETLRGYAHACVHLVHGLATAFGLPLVTMSVVTGQALGGGMEGALAEDFMLADAAAKLGVPEVAFNTFPGMGAVTLLSRRLGSAKAEEIIMSGRVFSAQEMFEAGVVDILAPEGESRATAHAWMNEGGDATFARRLAMASVRRQVFPVPYDELMTITDLWVDCSSDVTSHDLRHMERLASTQKRNFPSV